MSFTDTNTNIALKGTAGQFSTWNSAVARNAIDGDRTQVFSQSKCSHADYVANNYWFVDLGKEAKISFVKIYGRSDCCHERNSDFDITIGNSPATGDENPVCVSHGGLGTTNQVKEFTCLNGVVTGRYVKIKTHLNGDNAALTLCEVEVYGAFIN